MMLCSAENWRQASLIRSGTFGALHLCWNCIWPQRSCQKSDCGVELVSGPILKKVHHLKKITM